MAGTALAVQHAAVRIAAPGNISQVMAMHMAPMSSSRAERMPAVLCVSLACWERALIALRGLK